MRSLKRKAVRFLSKMKQKIYADNAATTQLDSDAYKAMSEILQHEYGNPSQPYSFSRTPKKLLAKAREEIAFYINAFPDEIYFTSGGTESDNWAISGVAINHPSKTIITSQIEHHAVLRTCEFLERQKFSVQYLPVTNDGIVMLETLKDHIDDSTALVSIMLANNEIGTLQPIKELAEVAHSCGALFHTDAVQALGHIPVDVKDLGVDLLSASAHKFNGPKGIGFLYVKRGTLLASLMHGGSQEFSLRAGTENIASIVGMSLALKNNCRRLSESIKKLNEIEDAFLSEMSIANIDYIINGSNQRIPGNISISIKNSDGEMLMHRLDLMGITVSTGAACDSKNTQVSHVIKAIGVADEYANGTIRISFGKDNTIEDARLIAEKIKRIIAS